MLGAVPARMHKQSEPAEEATIREAVGGRNTVKVRAFRRLVSDARVSRSGNGKKGDPYRYSVSSSLGPAYIREPENRNPKNDISTDPDRPSAIWVANWLDAAGSAGIGSRCCVAEVNREPDTGKGGIQWGC